MFRLNKVPNHVAGSLLEPASASALGKVDGHVAGMRGGKASTLGGARHIVWGKLDTSPESSSSNSFSHNDSLKWPMPKKPSKMALDDDILLQSGSSSGTYELIQEIRLQEAPTFQMPPSGSAPSGKPPEADLSEDDEDADPEDVQWQPQEGMAGYDNEWFKEVPLDEHGLPTSLGSIGHNSTKVCKMCPLVHTARGCPNGICCNLCHFSHPRRKRKCKDGKSKRDRYRKFREEMMGHIEAAPDEFIVDSEALPECIAKDERLKGKLLTRLRLHQKQLQKNLMSL